ncbi:hypothetical protein FT663_02940 [Candidozyma haemuli var. vulneris]|uniref:candidapepsin n=1 Tax=Candidozyma haemuli TaxID=45357 RepID=A0A2V1AW50_9ASCO|nr:hypothetical protein CXQ85_005358 [[Candida] haemuloni]KAF3987319.1 hypothetical protein FT662_04050 [[Candida] haemuloni var. vulneris]KAF3990974.1 hypothetical protein FT663_02940 [[Candida] haemuloni var. vulneris]PVH22330.1 hypothetical protein CXQ85_005358 [[Candida] haemuloni]
MLPLLTIFSLALTLVNGLVLPQESADLSKRDSAPLKLDFDIVKDTSKNSTLYHPERYFSSIRALKEQRSKRATSATITNERDISYILDVYLGSQHEKVTVLLDTGSSDLWVYGPSVSDAQGGTFDPSQSSDDSKTKEAFSINYLDGSGAEGSYYKDDFSFSSGSTLVKNFQFAVADSADADSTGILGVADKNQEAGESQYDNLPWALQKSGVTPKASYSLFLGSEQSGKGSIIFGGIDTEKFEGDLQKYSVSSGYGLGLSPKSASVEGQTVSLGEDFILDSGTSWNLWPPALTEAVASALGTSGQQQGLYIVSCDQPSDKHISFDFGQNTISIPYSDLVVNVGGEGQSICALGAQPTADDPYIFGDVFLRSAYVYYDLTDQTISIAQAKYTSASNIVAA